ncbi:HAD family hydrolase [Lutibaculum baratangense]|uniref:Phosphoglycolate phosphatase n=1 Tax=Lutibaculum baratangense AMV1 TaxID=631454 RepID=V4T8G5_9HYPH|nr:HAD family hydrolase [Lutibaculum baratangense]ESR22858.1 phosphoglycolate phosphatase [Lutibaculum baratangense AMV1]
MLTIFDCDGVLIDSEIISARVDAGLLATIGYKVKPEEMAERFAGFTTERIFEAAAAEVGRPLPEGMVEKAEAETDRRLKSEVKALAGAKEMLDQLPGNRCVCSNSRRERLEVSLRAAGLWGRLEPHIFSARDIGDGRGKPEPDVFLHAARQFEIDPREVIVVEDSPTGVTGAMRAGMRVIGFTGASHTYTGHAEVLTEAGAVTVVNRLRDVQATILALREWNPEAL